MPEHSVGSPVVRAVGLQVSVVERRATALPIIDRVDFQLAVGGALGIVGESGSGKSMLCRSLIGTLNRHGARIVAGELWIDGRDFANASESEWRAVRGKVVAYVPQASLAGLSPVLTVGDHMVEALRVVGRWKTHDAVEEAVRLLSLVRIARPRDVISRRAHELSGGMRQRVMIALALAQRPRLLIADEPTTALDVSVQAEILQLIGELRSELGMTLILVSHDLAVVDAVCDQLLVMYAGASVESGSRSRIVERPLHPYTEALRLSIVASAVPKSELPVIVGEPPAPGAWPSGCRFAPRCMVAQDQCRVGRQPLLEAIDGQETACLRGREIALGELKAVP